MICRLQQNRCLAKMSVDREATSKSVHLNRVRNSLAMALCFTYASGVPALNKSARILPESFNKVKTEPTILSFTATLEHRAALPSAIASLWRLLVNVLTCVGEYTPKRPLGSRPEPIVLKQGGLNAPVKDKQPQYDDAPFTPASSPSNPCGPPVCNRCPTNATILPARCHSNTSAAPKVPLHARKGKHHASAL